MFILLKIAQTLAISVVENNPNIDVITKFVFFNAKTLLVAKPIFMVVKPM
jgi:hypothetical protein